MILDGRRFLRVGLVGVAWLLSVIGPAQAAPVRAVATTGMVGDLVARIGGERVAVDTLMGPGVDPHLYRAGASDVIKLQRADVIFYNGLLLEGRLTEVLQRLSRSKRHIFALADAMPRAALLTPDGDGAHADPHLWFDVALWAHGVDQVVAGLSAADPAHAAEYGQRGEVVRGALAELHQWALAKAAELPPERRILVTSHDAYSYFGRAYGFEVIGLQGISTVSEAALADMAKLVDFIRQREVKAIFVESSVSPVTIQRIAQDAGVRIGGELFSDAMGQPGQMENGYDLGTYEGMVRHNLTTIVEALR